MKVVFSPAAKADLLEIALYIAQDNRLVHRRLAYWRIVQKNAAEEKK